MKKCPYCKAEIEENARFCLYCMKPLAEKETITPPKKRRWIWVFVAVVLVVCIGVWLLARGAWKPDETSTPHPSINTKPSNQTSVTPPDEDNSAGEVPTPSVKPPEETTPSSEPTEDSTSPETPPEEDSPTPCAHNYQLTESREPTCTTQGLQTYTCSLCSDSYQQTVAATGHQYTDPTCTQPKICTVCSQTDGQPLGHSYSDGYCIRCEVPDYTNPEVVFSYRAAAPGDGFSPNSDIGNGVVITGVKMVSPDGEYEVPDYIDGKPVVGIMPLAFSGSDVRSITLGKNVLRVEQNAFAGCFNIEALRIKSTSLFLSRSALIDAAHRSCKLTIYCAADCMVDDDLYGDCYLKDIVRVYGAEYQEL